MTTDNLHIGRILALDIGKKRIGLALSDPSGTFVEGLPTLNRITPRLDLDSLQTIVDRYEVTLLVVGDPQPLSGPPTKQTRAAHDFAELAGRVTQLPVQLWNERLTSVDAEQRLKVSNRKTRLQAKGQVDRVAAMLILDDFLNARLGIRPVDVAADASSFFNEIESANG